jgi:hypothetical protein
MIMKQIDKRQEFLTKKDLLSRGWKKSEIEMILLEPDFVKTYRSHDFRCTSYLYNLETVARMEATNHMDLDAPLLTNPRCDYIFWEDLYVEGWTETQLKTLLPTPLMIRNWDGASTKSVYKVWEHNGINGIAHELAFAVTSEQKEKALARRKKLAENKKTAIHNASLKVVNASKENTNSKVFDEAIANNSLEDIFVLISHDRVAIHDNYSKEKIIQAARKLGFVTNVQTKKYQKHWVFRTTEARELFMMEVVDFLYNEMYGGENVDENTNRQPGIQIPV